MSENKKTIPVGSICFGLSRDLDEVSIKALCERFSRSDLLAALIPRLSEQELHELADNLFSPMKKHLSKEEYHSLFLAERLPEEH